MANFDLGQSKATQFNPSPTSSAGVVPNVNWEGQLMAGLNNLGKAYSATQQNQTAADLFANEQPEGTEPWLAPQGATAEEKRASFEESEAALNDSRGAFERIKEAQRQGAYDQSTAAMYARQRYNEAMSNPLTAIYGDQLADEYRGLLGGSSNSFAGMFPKTQEELMRDAAQKGQLDAIEQYQTRVTGMQQVFGMSEQAAMARIQNDDALAAEVARTENLVKLNQGDQNLLARQNSLQQTQLMNTAWDMVGIANQTDDPVELEQARTGIQQSRRQAIMAANNSGLSGAQLQTALDNINTQFDGMLTAMDDQRVGSQYARIRGELMEAYQLEGAMAMMKANEQTNGLMAALSSISGPEAGDAQVSLLRTMTGTASDTELFTARGFGVGAGSQFDLPRLMSITTQLLTPAQQAPVLPQGPRGTGTVLAPQAPQEAAPTVPVVPITPEEVQTPEVGAIVSQTVEMNNGEVPEAVIESLSSMNLEVLQVASYEEWQPTLKGLDYDQVRRVLSTTQQDLMGQLGNTFNFATPIAVRPSGRPSLGQRIGTMTGAPQTGYHPDLWGTSWDFFDPITGEKVANVPEEAAQFLIGVHTLGGQEGVPTWVKSWSLLSGQTVQEVQMQAEAVQNNVDISSFSGSVLVDANGNYVRVTEQGLLKSMTEDDVNDYQRSRHTVEGRNLPALPAGGRAASEGDE